MCKLLILKTDLFSDLYVSLCFENWLISRLTCKLFILKTDLFSDLYVSLCFEKCLIFNGFENKTVLFSGLHVSY